MSLLNELDLLTVVMPAVVIVAAGIVAISVYLYKLPKPVAVAVKATKKQPKAAKSSSTANKSNKVSVATIRESPPGLWVG